MAHSIAPVGTKVLAYESSQSRTKWGTHGISGFYLGPALRHYRAMAVYVPSTNGHRVSDQLDFFPYKFKFPGASTGEILLKAITDLDKSVREAQTPPQELLAQVDKLSGYHIL